ncbi:EAL domain-containing protein [Magnetococcales bacterium HHB-1]
MITQTTHSFLRVFLVDDQSLTQWLLERMFEDQDDLRLEYCDNPADALTRIIKTKPDVILLDMVMPTISGMDILKQIRREPSTQEIPVILLSSADKAEIKAEAFQNGANDYVVKLPEKIEMLARIRYHAQAYRHLLAGQRNEALERINFTLEQKQQQLDKYAAIVSTSNDLMSLIDRNYTYQAVNRALLRAVNKKQQDMIGNTVSDVWGDKAFAIIQPSLDRCFQGEQVNIQAWAEFENLGKRWIDVSYHPYHQQGFKEIQGAVVITRDATDRKQAEIELDQSQKSLERTEKIASLGSWSWQEENDTLTWSQEMYRIFGIQDETFTPQYSRFRKAIHPEDAKRIFKALDHAKKQEIPYTVEYRIRCNRGDEKTIRETGEFSYDKQSTSYTLHGTIQDISQLSLVEEQLSITDQVFEHIDEGVLIMDDHGIIHNANPALTNITGFKADELIGKRFQECRSDNKDPAFYQVIWEQARRSGYWRGEVWNRRRNGEAYPELLTVIGIPDRWKKISTFIAVSHDLTSIKCSQEALNYQTSHDALTGLPNRELFRDRLQQAVSIATRTESRFAVVMLDLDRFKQVNHSLGHSSGDLILQEVARRIAQCIREGDTVSRTSGDEFYLIFRDVVNVQNIIQVVDRLMTSISEPFILKEQTIHLTTSLGLTLFPSDGKDADTLIRNANLAMSRAKEAGKDTYRFYTTLMGEKASQQLTLTTALREAVEREEFELHYQPKVSVSDDKIVGMEALVRWRKEDGTLISPAQFIPIAEETGLIIPLGEIILRKACQQTKQWIDQGYGPLRVAVNLCALQFQRPGLETSVAKILEETGLDAAHLEMEITESMMLEDAGQGVSAMIALSALGIQFSLDDFGTGYSSLSYLKRLPIHSIKIDRSFICDITIDSSDAAIVTAILSMAKSLDLKVIAEGVEYRDQLECLNKNGCDQIQGFFYSRPLAVDDFKDLLDNPKKLWNINV